MWQGMGRATRGMAACQLRNGTVVLGLLFLFAGDAAAQRFSRQPQRPARPGMNQGAPAANPASSSTRKRVGVLRGDIKIDKPFALSADGALFAGKADRSFTVYETRTGKLVAQLRVESPFAGLPGIGAGVQSVAESGRCLGLRLFGRDLRMPLGRAWALLDELIGQTRPFLEREGVV